MFAPQTNPASPAVLKTVKNLFSLCLSRMFTIASQAFLGLPIFLRRQFNWTSLVRLSDPCVSGGLTIAFSLTQSCPKRTGFLPKFSMIVLELCQNTP